jgi:hypothetical protein
MLNENVNNITINYKSKLMQLKGTASIFWHGVLVIIGAVLLFTQIVLYKVQVKQYSEKVINPKHFYFISNSGSTQKYWGVNL